MPLKTTYMYCNIYGCGYKPKKETPLSNFFQVDIVFIQKHIKTKKV